MKSRKAICIIFLAVALATTVGCTAKETDNSTSLMKYLPQGKNLPQGFKLVIIKNDVQSDPSKNLFKANMTDEIREFSSPTDIGPANATTANYWWAEPGVGPDAKVTIISLEDEAHAQIAISNYLLNYRADHTLKLPGNVSLINPTTINKHNATEIGEITGDNRIRLQYLWNNNSIVALVIGNSSREASKELASATGL